jgi:predicted anti-sigma-YlaC factor YlaD
MTDSGGQLCARARFWVSLRVDGELSELEGALLDAHLARCDACGEFSAVATGSTALLRAAPLEVPVPVRVELPGTRRKLLPGLAAGAAIVAAALVGGSFSSSSGSGPGASAKASLAVAAVASVETPDQLRRLRRTSLLNERRIPREVASEPA